MIDVGFIGLGDQGAPMAHAIARAGFRLHVWARRPEVLTSFVAGGAIVHDSAASLAAAVDHLGLCVLDDAAVAEILGPGGVAQALRPGTVLALHSTMAPQACKMFAREMLSRGVDVLDAPVSGGREGAQAGTLLVLVGGEADVVDKARPVFSSYADRIRHVGGVGAGQTIKILSNLLLNINLVAANEVLRLGDALGLDRCELREALLQGTAASTALDWLDRTILPGHPATLGLKDIGLALQLAQDHRETADLLEAMAAGASRGREALARDG